VLTSANEEVDGVFARANAGGNVVLAIHDCGSAGPLQLQILSRYYYRSSYAIYARPIEEFLSSSIQRVVLHMTPGAAMILLFGLPRASGR